MDAAIDRLDTISDRTESRIEKLTARGIDTANARRLLARVRTNLMQAGASMETIDTAVATFVSASEPAAEWQRVSAQFVDTRTSIVGAHQTLQVVVDELKQVISSGANIENASTSGTSE